VRVGHAAWAFATPALLIITVFFFVPVLAALIVSLTDFDLYALADIRNLRFVGLGNYRHLLHAPDFWRAVANTGYFVAVGVPLSLAASLASALLVNSRLAYLAGFFRTAFFAPVVTTLVAVAVVWRYLLHTRYGLLNYALAHLGIHPINWLGDPHWALPAIILFAVWKNFGYNMVIFLAALQSIPADLYEAARLDGASEWQVYTRIILPLSKPALAVLAIFTFNRYWNAFIFPLVILRDPAKYPVQVGLATLQGEFNTDFGMLMTGAAVAAIPMIAVFFAFQRYFIEGIRVGGVKG